MPVERRGAQEQFLRGIKLKNEEFLLRAKQYAVPEEPDEARVSRPVL